MVTGILEAIKPVIGIPDAFQVYPGYRLASQCLQPGIHVAPLALIDKGFRVAFVIGVGEQQWHQILQ